MQDRYNDGPNGESKGEFGPAPRHAHQGKSIEESYGAYYGEEYEQGVYGHQNPSRPPNMEHVGEQRIAAAGRALLDVEDRAHRRLEIAGHVGMPTLAIGAR